MKVKEFIDDLAKLNPEAEIVVWKWQYHDLGGWEELEEPELIEKDGKIEIH